VAKPIEISITYQGEKLRFDNGDGLLPVIVASARFLSGQQPEGTNGDFDPNITIKGQAEADDLDYHLTYRLYGRWSEYKNRRTGKSETQFHFDSFVLAAPHDKAGIIAYLAKAGEGLGIGRARASTLYTSFGQDAVRACREAPEQAAAAIKGWDPADARRLAAKLAEQAHLEAVSIELTGLLANRGFPKATAKHAIDLWGNVATAVIARDPYKLMAFRGCGFKRCDRMYIDLKLPPARMKRQALCAWYSIARDSDGHSWFPAEQAVAGIKQNVGGCELNPAKALTLAKRAGLLSFQRTGGIDNRELIDQGGRLWVAETKKADHERFIAEQLTAAASEPHEWPDVASLCGPSEHQRDTLAAALTGPVAILGGAPGTGKTYTAAAAILTILAQHGADSIAVAAPTGKAAVRITEALAGYGVPLRARTIHSLLKIEVQPDGSWGFHFRQGRPLPFKYIVVDESSMIDTDLMASLLAAIGKDTQLLFVSDISQLPPVGHGAPLRDMIAAGLPYGELREIRRNSGAIVRACAAIRDGGQWGGVERIDIDAGENLRIVEAASPEQQTAAMLGLLDWAKGKGFDPVWDCQVLAAVNAKSPLSRRELNKLLQHKLNQSPGVEGCPFRVGDKIVNTKNSRFKSAADPAAVASDSSDPAAIEWTGDKGDDIYVANGDLAEVVEVEDKRLIARLVIGDATIAIPRGKPRGGQGESEADGDPDPDDDEAKSPNTGCTWDLAYCLSTHKAQGSEWGMVIVMLDEYPGARMVCSREWLYTAISRGKRLTLLVGKEAVAKQMCRKVALGHRKTFLRELIERERSKVECEALVASL
jgi:exodeoxyribonuclease V alpha subunit